MFTINLQFINHTESYLTESDAAKNILENFPKLRYFYETFSQRHKLRKYLLSPARLPFKLPYPPQVKIESKTS